MCVPPSRGEDVYAFGAVLYELFTERVIWEGLLPFQIIAQVIMGNKPDTSSVDCAAIRDICDQCFKVNDARPTIVEIFSLLIHIE